MGKPTIHTRVVLDWSRLLGFDQDDMHKLGPKIGDSARRPVN